MGWRTSGPAEKKRAADRQRAKHVAAGLALVVVSLAAIAAGADVFRMWVHRPDTLETWFGPIQKSWWIPAAAALWGSVSGMIVPSATQLASRRLERIAFLTASVGTLVGVFLVTAEAVHAGLVDADSVSTGARAAHVSAWWVALAVGFVVLLFIDVNRTSLHRLYRDRLAIAFAVKSNTSGDVEETKEVPRLSALTRVLRHPFHIVCGGLHVPPNKTRLPGRRAESWVFTPLRAGFSDRSAHGAPAGSANISATPPAPTEYASMAELEDIDRHLDLVTAMAISGAAVSPNAGDASIRGARVVMTLLNARLGYWVQIRGAFRSRAAPHCEALGFATSHWSSRGNS